MSKRCKNNDKIHFSDSHSFFGVDKLHPQVEKNLQYSRALLAKREADKCLIQILPCISRHRKTYLNSERHVAHFFGLIKHTSTSTQVMNNFDMHTECIAAIFSSEVVGNRNCHEC